MTEKEKSSWTRPILLIALLLPISLFMFIYLGGEQNFAGVPYQYDIRGEDTVYHTLPVFTFVRPNGDTVTRADFEGKITLLSFFAVNDDSLSKTTVLFGNLQRTYDNVDWEMDPPFLFASINTGDSLGSVRVFGEKMGLDPQRWWLLSGPQETVLKVGREALDIPALSGQTSGFRPITPQVAALIDKEGRVRKYYVATDLQEEREIQEDLITLLRLDYPEEIERMREQE